MRQIIQLLDLVINCMFSQIETQYYSMKGEVTVRIKAVVLVDGIMDACDKCIGSELDLTDVTEDDMVDFGEERKNIKVAIEGTGVESAKSRSDHYVISVLVDQEIGLMRRPAKDIEQYLLELGSAPTTFSAVFRSGTILFSFV